MSDHSTQLLKGIRDGNFFSLRISWSVSCYGNALGNITEAKMRAELEAHIHKIDVEAALHGGQRDSAPTDRFWLQPLKPEATFASEVRLPVITLSIFKSAFHLSHD